MPYPSDWNPIRPRPLPRSSKARFAITAVIVIASAAWTYEAFTCGGCWISIHLAPFIIIGLLILNFGGLALGFKGWFRNYLKTIREIVHPPHD